MMSDREENVKDGETQRKIRNNVLEIFGRLKAENEKIIVRNGVKLLGCLVENQNDEKGRDELKYALCRLIRGLGASSHSTKQGFYTVLVGLLDLVDVEVSELLEIGERELHTSGGNSKSENADILMGQILLFGSIIRTGLFEKCTKEQKKSIVEKLLSAGKKRNYLFLLASTFLNQLCNNIEENEFKSSLWPVISPELSKPWSEQTVDTLYLLFVLNDRFPTTVDKKFIRSFLGSNKLVSKENLKHLANVLINIPRLETANHPVYDLLSKSLSTEKFATDFISDCDRLLTRYNYNRTTIFTLILSSIIDNLENPSLLPSLITKNYLQQTLQYLKTVKTSKKPEQLQEKIYDLFNKIVLKLKNENVTPTVKIEVLKKLLFDPGTFIFEKITRTKVIQQIIAGLCKEGVGLLGDIFKNLVLSDTNDERKEKFLNNDKVYAMQLLVKLIGHESVKEDFGWRVEQMKFLMEVGFVKLEKYSHIGTELSGCIRQSFYKALTTKQQSFNNVRILLWELAQHLNPFVKKSSLRCSTDENDTKTSWSSAYKMFKTIEKKEPNHLNHVYQTLFLFLAFRVFQDPNLTKESLEELRNCYERINSEKINSPSSELHFSEVMVDLFLCLLSYNSSLLRNLVNMVFPHFTKYLTDAAYNQILYVLNPENKDILSAKNKNEETDESSDDSEDGENDPEDSEDEENDSEDSEDEEIEDEDSPVDKKLRESVQEVLAKFGDEEIDLDEMDEDEGEKLDEALSLAFKKNFMKKKKRLSHKENLKMNFRIRTLDLVELYLDNEPSMLNCVETLSILLRLQEETIRDPLQKQLLERITKIIKKLSGLKRFSSIEGLLNEDKLKEFLLLYLTLLERGDKNVFILQAMRDSITSSCIFFVHLSQYLINSNRLIDTNTIFLRESMDNITTIALDSFFLLRDSPTNFEMFKIISRMNYFGLYELIRSVFIYVYLEDLKMFKKIQALGLLKDFFKNHRFLTTNPPTNKFKISLKIFVETTENIFEFSIENNSRMEEKFIRGLFDLLVTIKNSPVKIPFGKLIGLIKKYKEIGNFTNMTKNFYNKLSSIQDEEGGNIFDEIEENSKLKKIKKSVKHLKCKIEREKLKLKVIESEPKSCKRKIEVEEIENNKKSKKSIEEKIITNGNELKINKRRSLMEKKVSNFPSVKTMKDKRKSTMF